MRFCLIINECLLLLLFCRGTTSGNMHLQTRIWNKIKYKWGCMYSNDLFSTVADDIWTLSFVSPHFVIKHMYDRNVAVWKLHKIFLLTVFMLPITSIYIQYLSCVYWVKLCVFNLAFKKLNFSESVWNTQTFKLHTVERKKSVLWLSNRRVWLQGIIPDISSTGWSHQITGCESASWLDS